MNLTHIRRGRCEENTCTLKILFRNSVTRLINDEIFQQIEVIGEFLGSGLYSS